MASIRSIDQIANGIKLTVEVVSNFNNFLVVINNNHSLKGVLLPVNNENKTLLGNFINDCQRQENKNEESLFCIPDSTLSQTALDTSLTNNEYCNECKRTLKAATRRKSSKNEIERLTSHGFNELVLKKKNDISRRDVKQSKVNLLNGEDTKKCKIDKGKTKIEKPDEKKVDSDVNNPRPKKVWDKGNSNKEVILIRKTKERALKTQANEKIIDLCTRKPSKPKLPVQIELKKKKLKPKSEIINEVISVSSPIKLSDASIYDFVDEDCESEPTKPLYKNNKSYFIDKSNNSLKLDKRSYKRKVNHNKINNKDDEIHSNPGIISYEYKGTKFSINNIVWAKIPGYPFWPAHIKSFDNVSASKSQGKRCRINWIGWNQKSFLPLKSLLHFQDHFKVKYSAKFKSQKYKTAIELACKELGLDFYDLTLDMAKKSPVSDRNNSSQNSLFSKRKSIDLDDIFPSNNNNSKEILEMDMANAKAYSDEDTDEEEKARSALITAESLEAKKIISGIISKQSEYDY